MNYKNMNFRRCGNSGLLLPTISLGLWHNFGEATDKEVSKDMIFTSFDNGITHFDLANNYGPPFGSAETNFGDILHKHLASHRNEMVISTKAGHAMWEGPYGDWGSRKYMISSLHDSLKRLQLDYVDIFYSHRYDPNTPLEETMGALSDMVKQGKALYVGISKYPVEKMKEAFAILKNNGTPCLIVQDKYSIFNSVTEEGVIPCAEENKVGYISFSALAQGLLSEKYINGIPENSRAAQPHTFLNESVITAEKIEKIKALDEIAKRRGQTLPQMALAWTLRDNAATSAIIGASSTAQILENLKAIDNISFTTEELTEIKKYQE